MVTQKQVRETVDRLAVTQGECRDRVYHLDVTTGELIESFGLKPSAPHHRHIKGLVEVHYPGTIAEPVGRGDGSQGFKLHVRIRSK